MSDTEVQGVADSRTGQPIPPIEKNQAVSLLIPFPRVKQLLAGHPAPRRPNRNRPINVDDPRLCEELSAWDAASDEDFRAMESDLPE